MDRRVASGVVGPHPFGLLFAQRTEMDRFFNKKRKKSPGKPQQLGVSSNTVTGPGFRAEADIDPEGGRSSSRSSRLSRFDHDTRREGQQGSTGRISGRSWWESRASRSGSFNIWYCRCWHRTRKRSYGWVLLIPAIRTDPYVHPCCSPRQMGTLVTPEGEEASQQRYRDVRVDAVVVLASFNVYKLRRELGGTQCSGVPPFPSMPRERPQMDSALSKPF